MKPDALALWYLRLNGLFTIGNFILHPDQPGSARTDSDVAGVRFPFRSEFPPGDGGDDPWFQEQDERPLGVLAEVKTSTCAINGPWSDPAKGNINKVLTDLGWYGAVDVPLAAESLYQSGFYDGSSLRCSLFCVGEARSQEVAVRYPRVPQRTWSEIASWIWRRFDRYEDRKSDHNQWDDVGQALWRLFEKTAEKEFQAGVRTQFLLRSG